MESGDGVSSNVAATGDECESPLAQAEVDTITEEGSNDRTGQGRQEYQRNRRV